MSDTTTTPTPASTPTVESDPQPARATATESDAGDNAPLEEPGRKALAAERSARRAAEKAAAEAQAKVKEYEDRNKSELERLTEAATAAKAEADAARAEALRLRVAADTGLPADLHEFLVGDDEEQLRAKAQKLLAATAATEPRRPAPDPTQGVKPGVGAPDQLTHADLARMSPAQINEALEAGRFEQLLGNQ